MPNSKTYTCTVCGYPSLDEPPVDEYGCASFDICSCCGIQFGYHDACRSHEELRRKWIAEGIPWHSELVHPPNGWNATDQLRAAGLGE